MKRPLLFSLLGFVLLAGLTSPSRAQASSRAATLLQKGRFSPHDTISRKIDGNRVTIVYGRPYTNDPYTHHPRKIWGGLVPDGKIWRLGADEATLLVTQRAIKLGGLDVPAGAYTLFMLPAADGSAELIVNREIGQWGIDPYHKDDELGRVPLTRYALPSTVDEFTIVLDNGNGRGGVLKLMWEQTGYSVDYTVQK
ncbi:MAG TPA: DUF2911 domain-containing protein [Opitutaceae bacterium]|nr:DUF2911 domain-containing protein [Opitutaceae bacterium]